MGQFLIELDYFSKSTTNIKKNGGLAVLKKEVSAN